MKYDSRISTAVFLGPTMPREEAVAILPANYYPPVKMGDVYKLMSTGVETILIIDGVFHAVTPVWQREILSAMNLGIQVIGASSMGALRAAELHVYGMVGVGKIFEWYRDDVIDGDDEVALLHADELRRFRSFTEPLVNIRFNLERAEEQGIISRGQRLSLIEVTKRQAFPDRTYQSLFAGQVFRSFAVETQAALKQFIELEGVDLKRSDAILALEQCRRRQTPPTIACRTPAIESSDYQAMGAGRRGVMRDDGGIVTIREILDESTDHEAIKEARRLGAGDFFVGQWIAQHPVDAPADFFARFRRSWIDQHDIDDLPLWLTRNGLTFMEFDQKLRALAEASYLYESLVDSDNADFADYRLCVEAILSAEQGDLFAASGMGQGQRSQIENERSTMLTEAAEGFYVVAWAREHGISCPLEFVDDYIASWEREHGINDRSKWLQTRGLDEAVYLRVWNERALYHWVIDHGPSYFGYSEHAANLCIVRRLQMTGRIAELATAQMEAAV